MSAAGAPIVPAPEPDTGPVPDYDQVRAIVGITLRRLFRSPMVGSRRGRKHGIWVMLGLYGVLGFLLGLLAFTHADVFTFSAFVWAYTLLVAGLTMVGESSTLLFDPSENDILGHRPIHPRTLLLAKSIGLLAVAAMLTLVVNIVPMFTGIVAAGSWWFFPIAHFVTLVLLVLFASSMVVFLYGLIARFVSRRTFDAIVSWSQVLVTVVLIFSYQLLPRMMDRLHDFKLDAATPWLLALPPIWFAAVNVILIGGASTPRLWFAAAMAVGFTPVMAWLALRYLAAGYARQVAALSETAAPDKPRRVRAIGAKAPFWSRALTRVFLRDPVERGAFRLAAAYIQRDRDMRMRIYPALAAFLVFPVIAIIDRKVGARFGPIMTLYMAGSVSGTAMLTLKTSQHYLAGDVFRYAPLAGTAAIFHGVRKATLSLLVLPGLVFAGLILWFGTPDKSTLVVTLPALLALPTLSLVVGLGGSYLPLSMPPTGGRQGMINVLTTLVGGIIMAIATAIAMIAVQFHWFWQMLAVQVVLLAIVHPMLLRGIRVRPLREDEG
jgi:hypothetical protein